jgi:hypothetical protein
MTEAEWLACTDPKPMLEFMRGNASERKLRLFACACCRHYWHVPENERSREAVQVAERFGDGQATIDDLIDACSGADGCAGDDYINRAFCLAAEPKVDVIHVSTSLVEAACAEAMAAAVSNEGDYLTAYGTASSSAYAAERGFQCRLVRDVFGTPFGLVTLDPAWQTPAVVKLAQGIYDERTFDRLPKLADALEKAGCDTDEVLAHCRQPGEHVRGCWVVDLILGKE